MHHDTGTVIETMRLIESDVRAEADTALTTAAETALLAYADRLALWRSHIQHAHNTGTITPQHEEEPNQ